MLPTPSRESSSRALNIHAHLGKDPECPNSNTLTTEVRVAKVKMSANFTHD